jgi:LPXTG-site transpeptidase (sortase) family protein
MPDEVVDRLEPSDAQPRQEPPPGARPPDARPPRWRHAKRSTHSRRRWARWLANLLIVAGVLLLAYPISTWGYTWFAQRSLAHQLTQNDPSFDAAQAVLKTGALVPLKPAAAQTAAAATTGGSAPADGSATVGNSASSGSNSAPANGPASGSDPGPAAAVSPAEAQRLAELAAFQAAAVEFASTVRWKTGTPLGRIVIPSIGLDVVMVEGTGKGDLREGPGHWPETPFPGQGGNFVVSGHRTTYGAPFLKINKIKVGDEIDLVLPYGVARYAVTRIVIVKPDAVQTVAQLGKEQVSLAACHPIYSAKQRIVVQGDLVAFKLVQQ